MPHFPNIFLIQCIMSNGSIIAWKPITRCYVLMRNKDIQYTRFIEVPIPSQESQRSCICVLGVASQRFLLFITRVTIFDRNSESDYFFFLHQNKNIFFSNIGNQNIFFEKNHNPPFKLNGRSLKCIQRNLKICLSCKKWIGNPH
jgi:hypothetical protein